MNYNGFNNIPIFNDAISVYNGQIDPSVSHTDSTLKYYFMKYLLEKIISVYEFEGLPDEWDKAYFLYTLFCWGYVGVFNHKDYGVIAQHGTLNGRGLYYQPTHFLCSNPLFNKSLNLKIGKECALIKLQPNYSGVLDIVSYYADLLALASESATSNLINTKLAYVFMAKDKASAESFKKMFDKIASNQLAVFADKKLFDEDGNPQWMMFNQNLKQTYIAPDILVDMTKIMDMFNSEIGIPNANTEKKERMLTDEVNANNVDTQAKASLWLECMQDGLDDVNAMYDKNITVKFRFDDKERLGGVNEFNTVNTGIVPSK